MKIAVCDDSITDRRKLIKIIKEYAEQRLVDFEIDEFSSGIQLLDAFQSNPYRIIFLDIYMDELTGVQIAYKIRHTNRECMIIFTTTSPDFRAEGFEIGAVHYLLKPLGYKGVEEALNRCTRVFSESERYLTVIVSRQSCRVLFRDILFVEVYGKTALIHTLQSTLKTYMPLAKIEEQLKDGPFLRCHRCYIVNMGHISAVLDKAFQLENGEIVPIRKNGQQEVRQEYHKYILRSIRSDMDA